MGAGSLRLDALQSRRDLSLKHLRGLTGFALFQVFADTDDRDQAVSKRRSSASG